MALISPGVQVSVIDESFYTPAEPGTRPLFIVASGSNKPNGSGTGTAQGTLAANAGKVYLITSQRDLVDTFGDPTFKVDANNNPIHAGEQNEYGLHAAYSFLGVSNSVLVVRANLDLTMLDASADAPSGEPQDGTFWLDTGTTQFGIFQWDGRPASSRGQSFTARTPAVILDPTKLEGGVPRTSVGQIGEYAIAVGPDSTGTDNEPDADDRDNHVLTVYYKNRNNQWVEVGSNDWKASWPTVTATVISNQFTTTGFFAANGVDIDCNGSLNVIAGNINDAGINGFTAEVLNNTLQLYYTGDRLILAAGGAGSGTPLTDLGIAAGTYYPPSLAIQPHTQIPSFRARDAAPRPTGSVWIKTTEPNAGARWRVKKYNANTQLWEANESPLYTSSQAALAALDPAGGGANLSLNATYIHCDIIESPATAGGGLSFTNRKANFRAMRRARSGATVLRTKVITGTTFVAEETIINIAESLAGSATLNGKAVTFTPTRNVSDSNVLAAAINAAGFTNVFAEVDNSNRVIITHRLGGEIRFGDFVEEGPKSTAIIGTALGLYGLNEAGNGNVYLAPEGDEFYSYVASNWVPLTITPDTAQVIQQSYYIQAETPSTLVANGALWYSSVVDEVDIMIHNGATWVGYRNYDHGGGINATDENGPIVSASRPTSQSDGTALEEGDLWIDTSDIGNYPIINRYDFVNKRWIGLDKSDQTTENGVVFADARWAVDGTKQFASSISDLLNSNYLDFDAPDPALYPRGMLLWNLRRSGFNVKRFERNYVDLAADNIRYKASESDFGQNPGSGDSQEFYYPHRWVTESGNQPDGSGSFGRNAQRKVIVQALQATVNSNQQIRDTERNGYNLLACPGYPELIGEMITLNYDNGLSAFVVGDSPARLTPDATSINEWGTNLAGALQDDDTGLVSFDEYLGVFYPWGFTSDNAGNDVAVPPSHMICRMIALSDQVSYPWFAPAGTRRGGITNATAVGYITNEGEFQSVALNEGQRDTLYTNKVNPITFFVGAGLVNFGQKTRARNASALDRINVARLVIYLRSQLNKLAKPYIFEPNDKITRDEIKQQVESLLLELVGQRALYDFLVVCDESNNTPNRIDRNELYVDIAIEPVKAVEFIYIPVRLKNTGEIAGL